MKQFFIAVLISSVYIVTSAQNNVSSDSVAAKNLNEVVVTAYSAPYKITKGGLITKVKNTPLSDAGNCFDVLAQLPGIRVDGGNIEVTAKGIPQIYINGRRMLDRSELERISSKEIQNIEVVFNPGAKYGADVKSVILIKTIRKHGDGLSGSMLATGRQAHSFSISDNIALAYRTKGTDVFGSFNIDHARRYQHQRSTTSIITTEDAYLLETEMSILPVSTNIVGNIGLNQVINQNHSFGVRYEYAATPYSKSLWNSNETIGLNGSENRHIASVTHWDRRSMPTNTLSCYYLGKINAFTINISNDYFTQRSNSLQEIAETPDFSKPTFITGKNVIRNRLWASKGILAYTFGNNQVEIGYEISSTDRKDCFANSDAETRDADDHIKESNYAGFVSVNVPVKKFEFGAGVRYERVVSDYFMYSEYIPEQSRKYSRLYPDFDFSFPIRTANFTLSYTATTKRPRYSQLGSAIQYDDRFTYETGNPNLVSETIHDVSLAGVWKWVFFSMGWQYAADAIVSTIRPYKENSPVNIMSYENIPHLTKYNLVLSLSPKFGRWTPRLRLNLLGHHLETRTLDGTIKLKSPVLF